ncbi:AraC family transcriptional regulator [Paenibacillus sp. WQ 127069]|uniref:AraC family transcriptional regulator n=1 Tax=Paenibacillus baimaensis TaxID=2982185 RepID=A0ABT2UA64_9BACL|nr:AraC family transcriptional regulator [Paenibacillus sp. WQ 127069]MCU6791076.1 AraC family transcriptional regulator [Paenibacillus sp. WQ 127069]
MRISKYMIRLIGFTFCLAAVPLLILGYLSYRLSADELESKAKQVHTQRLEQTKSEMDNMLAKLDFGMIQFAESPDVTERMRQPLTEEDYKAYQNLSSMLSKLGSTNSAVRALYLVNLDYDWMIDQNRLERFSQIADKERFLDYATLPNSSTWLTVPEKSGESTSTLLFIRKLPLTSMRPGGLLVAEIDLNGIIRQLSGNDAFHASQIFDANMKQLWKSSGTGTLQSTAAGEAIEPISAPQQLRNELAIRSEMQGVFRTSGVSTQEVTYMRSPYTGWYYVWSVFTREKPSEAGTIGWMTLLVCLILLSATALIVWFGSKKMYNPVKKLFETLEQTDQAIAEPEGRRVQDEFLLMERRIARLLSAESQIRTDMAAVLPQAKELFALKLFTGQLRPMETEEKRRLLDISSQWEGLTVIVLQLDAAESRDSEIRDHDLIILSISLLVSGLLPEQLFISTVPLGQSLGILLMNPSYGEQEWKEELNRWGRIIQQTTIQRLNVSVSLGVSRRFNLLDETSRAYAETMDVLRYRMPLGPGGIHHYEEAQVDRVQRVAEYPHDLERQLLEAVRLSQTEWAVDWLRSFFRYFADHNISSGQYRHMVLRLMFNMISLVEEEAEFLQLLFSDKRAIEKLSEDGPMEEKERWFRAEVLLPVIQLLAKRMEETQQSLVKAIIHMIHEHEGTDLTLEACSARLHFHPNYVSRVFKKECGLSFSDYMAQYRLNLSKQWLKEADMKISDIASRLHYNSPASFIRYFRNMEGMTPGDYRKMYARTAVKPKDEGAASVPINS